ncbi:MAG: hypothetical protein ACR2QK_18940 [Acidimicrobiales bacterium]
MTWVALLSGLAVACGLWLLLGTVRRTPPSLVVLPVGRRSGVSVATQRHAGGDVVGRARRAESL